MFVGVVVVIGICTPNCAFSSAPGSGAGRATRWIVILTANEVVLRLIVANVVVNQVAALIDEWERERLLGIHQRRVTPWL